MKQHNRLYCTIIALAVWSLLLVSYVDYKNRRNILGFHRVQLSLNKTSEEPHFQKPFLYLTETESCLPQNLATPLGNASACNCDVIVLSFRTPCNDAAAPRHISYLLDPKTTWASGRNVLFFAALDRRPGYHYYIFINDDTVVKFNGFTPPEMAATLQPLRVVEKWLLDYEPALGVLDYLFHSGAQVHFDRRRRLCGITETSLVMPVVYFDGVVNAFHHKAVSHLLPYREEHEYDSWWFTTKNIISGAEIKFRGQVLMFTAVVAHNPTHRAYPRSSATVKEIDVWRGWINEIRQLTPSEYRNNSLFDKMLSQPWKYTSETNTLCMKVTKHQAIVPYAHFRST